MSRYWDTSGIIRAYLRGWKPEGFTRAHAVAEFLCVFTGPGVMVEKGGQLVKAVLSATDAAKAAREVFGTLSFHDLTGPQTLDAGDALAKVPDVKGKAVHDFMHVRAAELHQAESIVTLNVNQFFKMTKLRLEMPAEHFAAPPGAGAQPAAGSPAAGN